MPAIRSRLLICAALGASVLLVPGRSEIPLTRTLAACNDVVDTTDSFSMNCAPTLIPDFSDQLTEAEVAEPGWNAVPGGGTGPRR